MKAASCRISGSQSAMPAAAKAAATKSRTEWATPVAIT